VSVRYARSPWVLWRRVGDRVVVLSRHRPQFTMLEASAPLVWQLLATPKTLDELATAVAASFGTSPPAVRESLAGSLEELLRLGIIGAIDDGVPVASLRGADE
jgi:Coenzyme PQQ synthesis protein D (PqqD)